MEDALAASELSPEGLAHRGKRGSLGDALLEREKPLPFQAEVPGRSEQYRVRAGRMLGWPPKGWDQHLGLDRDLAALLLVP